jgi:hypothetical protein
LLKKNYFQKIRKDTRINTPILLLAYRRPHTLKKVLDALRAVEAKYLYLACDGPHPEKEEDKNLVSQVRKMLMAKINWRCSKMTRFSNANLGLKVAVETSLNWFFAHVEEGIILEDDCVPGKDFFSFCSNLLVRYRNNKNIGCITGNNFQSGNIRGESSYYFSKYPHCWGWATWRRAWHHYNSNIDFWPKWKKSKEWSSFCGSKQEKQFWESLFDRQAKGKNKSWAYSWTASLWHAGCLTATPQKNLVQNIGFGEDATNTKNKNTKLSIPSTKFNIIKHPEKITRDFQADKFVFGNIFCPQQKEKIKYKILKIIKSLLIQK